MKKSAVNSLRVAYENWHDGSRFSALLSLLDRYPCAIDHIHLFTSATHAPLTIAEMTRRVNIMKERIPEIRAHGFQPGINILATLGHHCEDLDNSLQGPYRHMTNIHGQVCHGSYCMNDSRYLAEYVVPVYRMLAEAGPAVIWVDDDVRYSHMPIGNGCFCDGCMAIFNETNDTNYTREELKAALDSGDVALRKRWLRHQSDSIIRLFRLIGKTVRVVDESITLGFMTGERYFEGYDFAGFAAALSEEGRYPIFWRPGGGAYTDASFDSFTAKAGEIGRQNAYLPDYVTVVQSEIENFPYQLLKKTPKSTASEGLLYMTSGCTGAAFNILPSESGEPIENCLPHLKAIDRAAPFYTRLHEMLHELKLCGIHNGWRPDALASLPAGDWVNMHCGYGYYTGELTSFGLPECYHPDYAEVVTLTGAEADGYTDEEIRKILSGGVYMDGDALVSLNKRGFGAYTGFVPGDAVPVDAREIYLPHPMNEGIERCLRNCRQAFNYGMSMGLVPTSETCVSLCALTDYHDGTLANCALGIYENSLGGRVAVAGYYPWSWISDMPKTVQLKRLFAWLAGGSLTAFADSYGRCRVSAFRGKDGDGREKWCVTVFNTGNDDLYDVAVCVQTDSDTGTVVSMDGTETTVPVEKYAIPGAGTTGRLNIARIAPYEMAVIAL